MNDHQTRAESGMGGEDGRIVVAACLLCPNSLQLVTSSPGQRLLVRQWSLNAQGSAQCMDLEADRCLLEARPFLVH